MTRLSDLIRIDHSLRDAAIRLDDGLLVHAEKLVDAFTPTHSSVSILLNVQKAVLANASQQLRAMIWHGVYGSGKSHLSVLVGELLSHGTSSESMRGFLVRLRNVGESKLADALETTFHPIGDPDARPYLIVTLYGSPAPTLQNALLEGLYQTLLTTPGLDPDKIIPKTEFSAALERLNTILEIHPDFRSKPLSHWNIQSAAFNLDELETQLTGFEPEALDAFKVWHPKVSAGALFDPQALGGKGVTEAFLEAAAALKREHGFNGIAVIWDEFGYAIENLINQPQRNPVQEIFDLQRFVESVCAPPSGHTLFIAVTHRSLREYGSSTQAGMDVQNRLETIEGRFSSSSVALKSSEAEGYHLLSALVALTPMGKDLLAASGSQGRSDALAQVCSRMPLFQNLVSDIKQIVTGCYPLHPLTAAGLFAIAAHGVYAQANRTVFTFYGNLDAATAGCAFERDVIPNALYNSELVRLPELLKVYQKDIFEEYPGLGDAYLHGVATVSQGFPTAYAIKRDILSVLLLARVLGDQFQPTDAFLAAALYDTETETVALKQELELLQRAGLIWRRETDVPVWELESDSGIQIEPLIEQELKQLRKTPLVSYLQNHVNLRQELFPQCGDVDLDPSSAGIVRSFQVRLIGELSGSQLPTPSDPRISALVLFLTLQDARQADSFIRTCDTLPVPPVPTYMWIPKRGLAELVDPIRRYIVVANLLKQQAGSESVARRLRNELDKIRRSLRSEIRDRIGRGALERGEVVIKRIGDPDENVKVNSWHGFTDYIANQLQSMYPKEIQVRAMNANRLYNPGDRRVNRIDKLLRNILHFEELPSNLRTDLLGETSESSEIAALIDGTLGVYTNAILQERPDGWAMKTPGELDGAVRDVLTLIRDRLLDKRRKSCDISELRTLLMSPPYGLPLTAIPIFVAVAIRKDVARLKWVGKSSESFETNLWNAFSSISDKSSKLRFDTFKPRQLVVLEALRRAMGLPDINGSDIEEHARETLSRLRKYYSDLPDTVRNSARLSGKARDLFDALRKPGLDAQDIADALLALVHGVADNDDMVTSIRDVFREVDRIRDERFATVLQVVAPMLDKPEDKQCIIENLGKTRYSKIAEIFGRADLPDQAALSEVASVITGKSLDQCSDIEIGRFSGDLERILEQAKPASGFTRRDGMLPEATTAFVNDSTTSWRHTIDPDVSTVMDLEDLSKESFSKSLSTLVERYSVNLGANEIARILDSQLARLRQYVTDMDSRS